MKIRLFLYVIFWIAGFMTLHAQNNADSLKTLLSQTTDDTVYVDILNTLAKFYSLSDPILALDYAVKADKIAENCNYYKGLALSYYTIGAIYADKGNNELALEYYERSIKIHQLQDDKKSMAQSYDNMGRIYRHQKKFDQALDYHSRSLELKIKLKDSTGISNSFGNMGLVYSEQGKYDKALIQFYNSLRLKETLKDKYGIANSYCNIGVIYFEIESFDQAQINLERALIFYDEVKNLEGIAASLLYLGEIYHHQGKNVNAIDALKRCLELNKEQGRIKGIAEAYLKIGTINMAIGKTAKAHNNLLRSLEYYNEIEESDGIMNARLALAKYHMDLGDREDTKFQLKKSLNLSILNKNAKKEYEISKLLASLYLEQENYYKASQILIKANALHDSLSFKNLTKEITQIKMQYEFEKKMQEREVESLRIKSSNQMRVQKMKMVRNITIVILFFILIFALIINKKSIETRKKNLLLEKQQQRINRQVKELTKQKQALEKANQTKDKFMSIIGHDLRNPFNAINSFVSLITEQSDQMDDASMLKYLYLIKDASANAMSLFENLLEWAKIQSGIYIPYIEEVSINYILRGNVLLIKEMARQKNIELIEQLKGNPIVNIDKNMINTVIRNLLSNALKFTKANGKIWIKTIVKNSEIKIIVQDTGAGMTEDQLSNLFVAGVIKHGVDGMASSGLGLILCKEFLLQHRQELRVDSKKDYGTTFWFYLPLSE
ncbi:MAG: tetratricopeptide repeat-containing sensor histidine kinase [Salinivirgaceae bacterium]|nr:tetratricopeptide repeat-containing sensor histidine kinase [Salinivirgaceae bacterium]